MKLSSYIHSSIGRKQIVAATGLVLILFILGHLAGNLLIYLGPEAYNNYAKKLAGLRPGLYVVEFALLVIFVVHMWVTALLVLENIRARGEKRYTVTKPVGNRSLATRLMPYTGSVILIFVITHLLDFTFTEHHGPRSLIHGIDYGLYGLIYTSFMNPLQSLWYIAAMCCLGFHLAHGIQSFAQTFGLNDPSYTPVVQKFSNYAAVTIALAYSSIPIFVMVSSQACLK